jgi:hypothetical protein
MVVSDDAGRSKTRRGWMRERRRECECECERCNTTFIRTPHFLPWNKLTREYERKIMIAII